jgi:DNA topoisomerase-1
LAEIWRDFSAAAGEAGELRVSEVIDALDAAHGPHVFPAREDGSDPRVCALCGTGRLSLKRGKYGAFVGCSNYPECRYTRQLGISEEEAASVQEATLGTDPDTGLPVFLKNGRFGPYVQLGQAEEGSKEKPKRQGVPKVWQGQEMTLDRALALLGLPREIGPHPDDGEIVTAGLGRYGPYVHHGSTYASLGDVDEVFEVGLNRAVELLAQKRAGRGRGRRGGAVAPVRELGAHPVTGEPIGVYAGRYGPYVKHEKTNATLPKDLAPETVTLEQAVELIEARAAKGGKARAPVKKAGAKPRKPDAKRAKSDAAAE